MVNICLTYSSPHLHSCTGIGLKDSKDFSLLIQYRKTFLRWKNSCDFTDKFRTTHVVHHPKSWNRTCAILTPQKFLLLRYTVKALMNFPVQLETLLQSTQVFAYNIMPGPSVIRFQIVSCMADEKSLVRINIF